MCETLKKYEHIVFCVEHYNPLGVIRSLGEAGLKPIAIVIKGSIKIASKSKYISKLYSVTSTEEGYEVLTKIIGNYKNKHGFLYTCDDKTMQFIDSHYESLKDKLYLYNAGKNDGISYFMNKENIINLAVKHGINVARTFVVDKGEIPEEIKYPIITKSIASTIGAWKGDVFICNNETELKTAYSKIQTPRLLLQEYVEKKDELCMEGFSSNSGNDMFIAIRSSYNYLLPDQYSPYMTIKNVPDSELQNKLKALLREIGFEGIFEIELLEGKDGNLYFLEINFRNSTWSYAATKAGMSLPVLWAESMLSGKIDYTKKKVIPDGFMAMVEPHDFQVRVKSHKISLLKWLIEFKNCKCHYYVNIRDMGPIWSMINHKLFRK